MRLKSKTDFFLLVLIVLSVAGDPRGPWLCVPPLADVFRRNLAVKGPAMY